MFLVNLMIYLILVNLFYDFFLFFALLGIGKVGTKKEVEGYDEASDEEIEAVKGLENNDDSDNEVEDGEGNERTKMAVEGEGEIESDDDSDDEGDSKPSSTKQSSASSSTSSSNKNQLQKNTKNNSRVSFGGTSTATSTKKKSNVKIDIISSGLEVKSDEDEGWLEIILSYPASSRRLLMVQLGE